MNLLTTHRKSEEGLSTGFEKSVENKKEAPPPTKGSGASAYF